MSHAFSLYLECAIPPEAVLSRLCEGCGVTAAITPEFPYADDPSNMIYAIQYEWCHFDVTGCRPNPRSHIKEVVGFEPNVVIWFAIGSDFFTLKECSLDFVFAVMVTLHEVEGNALLLYDSMRGLLLRKDGEITLASGKAGRMLWDTDTLALVDLPYELESFTQYGF